MNLLLRILLVVAGAVFAASLAVAGLVTFALWSLAAAWARLGGRSATPFVLRMHPFGAFGAFGRSMRRTAAEPGSRTPRADALGARPGDVTDVEPKPPVR